MTMQYIYPDAKKIYDPIDKKMYKFYIESVSQFKDGKDIPWCEIRMSDGPSRLSSCSSSYTVFGIVGIKDYIGVAKFLDEIDVDIRRDLCIPAFPPKDLAKVLDALEHKMRIAFNGINTDKDKKYLDLLNDSFLNPETGRTENVITYRDELKKMCAVMVDAHAVNIQHFSVLHYLGLDSYETMSEYLVTNGIYPKMIDFTVYIPFKDLPIFENVFNRSMVERYGERKNLEKQKAASMSALKIHFKNGVS